MQTFVFIDLDDTLFQTLRKCRTTPAEQLQVKSFRADGSPLSYATPKQQRLWQWLATDCRIIPVTARDHAAFSRVDLPFVEEAVINHGAVILDADGRINTAWWQRITSQLPSYQTLLFDLWREVEAYAKSDADLKPYFIDDFAHTWYGVVKHRQADERALLNLLDNVIKPHPHIISGQLYWHQNGNNLAVLPDIIRKDAAVAFLLESLLQQHEELLTIGIGDSHTDQAFMALCDYAMLPKQTQLAALLGF